MKSKTLPKNGINCSTPRETGPVKVGDVVYLKRKPQQAGKVIAVIERGYSTYYSLPEGSDPAAEPNNNKWFHLQPAVVILCPDGMLRSGSYDRDLQAYIDELQAQLDRLKKIKADSIALDVDEYDVDEYIADVAVDVENEK